MKTFAQQRKLMVSLSCGHTIVLERYEAAKLARPSPYTGGNHLECHKCPVGSSVRRIVERSWISAEKKERT